MQYLSTRGHTAPSTFETVLLTGIAPDGGLFVPVHLPSWKDSLPKLAELSYEDLCLQVFLGFTGNALDTKVLTELINKSYQCFTEPAIVPVHPLGNLYVAELFHGPTFAFKDIAMRLLGSLFSHCLQKSGEQRVVIGATSGDTGASALHALRGLEGITAVMLYPHGRIGTLVERQMTTLTDANVYPVAIDGNFDDCQALVKQLFQDPILTKQKQLAAVNSINWVRILAQIVYCMYAYFSLLRLRNQPLGTPVQYCIPSGNFGHMYAAILAKRMGIPIQRLIVATNSNAVLHHLVQTGCYQKQAGVQPTLSPSMDIQVASNFERYLYDLLNQDASAVTDWLSSWQHADDGFNLPTQANAAMQQTLVSSSCDDATTLETIRKVYKHYGRFIDPHTAVGYAAAEQWNEVNCPTLLMSTAHPAKFPDAVYQATGEKPPAPEALQRIALLPVRNAHLANELGAVREFILANA